MNQAVETGGGNDAASVLALRDIIVIGGSYGSLLPIRAILTTLPRSLGASVFMVQHRPTKGPNLREILAQSSVLPIVEVKKPIPPEPATIYIPAPDHHLIVEPGRVFAVHGPRENLSRPAIDVLFRSAAVAFGPRVIGLILSGTMADGVAGLLAVRRCGGLCLVQEPEDATADELPRAAALVTVPDHSVRGPEMGALLSQLVQSHAPPAPDVPRDLALEVRASVSFMLDPMELEEIGQLTQFNCPECNGPLWHVKHSNLGHYRCHVGHSFSTEALLSGQSQELERGLWIAFRALRDRAQILERMMAASRQRGMSASADSYEERLREVEQHSRAVLKAMSSIEILGHSKSSPDA